MNFSIMDIISIVGFVVTVISAIGYKVYKKKTKINISNNNISNNINMIQEYNFNTIKVIVSLFLYKIIC